MVLKWVHMFFVFVVVPLLMCLKKQVVFLCVLCGIKINVIETFVAGGGAALFYWVLGNK